MPGEYSKQGAVLGAALLLWSAHAGAQQAPERSSGESIYRTGLLPSGQSVSATREGNAPLSAANAACSNCHRRSGLGELEGSIKIPPIGGPYLFHARAHGREDLDIPYVEGMRIDRDPYTPDALARAIREGIGVDGKPLNYLMPRYALSDADMGALIDYLKAMKPLKARGVAGSAVNFATIVTPDADPVKRRGMLSVLEQYFADQNAFALAQSPKPLRSESAKSNAKRRWQLHVWALTGAPETWEEQLERHLAAEPVYAVISGLGGKDWRPVHRFCEHATVPCIFPNLDLPVMAEDDVYPLYFSKGVLLEALLLAEQIAAGNRTKPVGRVVQIFRADDVGADAAASLKSTVARAGIQTFDRPLGNSAGSRLTELLRTVRARDVLILWLRPRDFAGLAHIPPRASGIFASGLMGGLESTPVPAAWRSETRLAYPVELPDKRLIGTEFALGWMRQHHIPVLDAQVQVDTYVACGLTLETLTRMQGSFNADYLVERIEGMLEHQLVSGYYPALALAPDERFASKGGYIVHFATPTGTKVVPDTEWRVPLDRLLEQGIR
ncbi:MAG: c-type cytochrome [Steroidobacteraceae bacterium]